MLKTTRYAVVVAACVVVTNMAPGAQSLQSQEKSAFMRYLEQDYMFGDWGGARSYLKEHGVDFEFVYFGALASNLEGGLQTGSVLEGGLLSMLDLYSDRLFGYEGGQFHAGSAWIHNEDGFAEAYVGDLNKASLLDFPDNLTLWELWYEHKFLDNRLSIKAGQLAVDRDFVLPEYYNTLAGISLLNQTFFFPTVAFNIWDQAFFPVGRHALPSTPYGSLGARVRVDPSPAAYLQAGVYDGNFDRTKGGGDFTLDDEEGALIYGELGIKINQGRESSCPPGVLKLGGYYHTDEFYDMYEGAFVAFDNYVRSQGLPIPPISSGTADTHQGNYGLYALLDQMLWLEEGKEDPALQGLTGFVRGTYAPKDRNLAHYSVDGGLVYKGLFPSRDWDTLSIAGSYMRISDDLAHAQRDINNMFTGLGFPGPFSETADYEAILEISYKAQVTAWWTLQASIQRIFHPGGRVLQATPDSWALVLQTVFRL